VVYGHARWQLRIPAATRRADLDARVMMHYYATGITPAMVVKSVGVGSQYAIAHLM